MATTTVEDFDRFTSVFSTKVPRSAGSTARRVRSCSRPQPTRLGLGDLRLGSRRLAETDAPRHGRRPGKGRPQVPGVSGRYEA